ncbi:MAG: site-specific DNA-methyltransferase [Candidatus Nomurabacteria bacterium]|jgi:adenine-specific DNA-methyltransferase|nr:site-specific DNA-methyltransferase [Candidatus Nomurabacteria bacterium]
MDKMDGKSDDITKINLTELARIFPEAVSEGKINWDELKATLGEEVANPDDRYGLNWKGKSDVFAAIQQRISKTLKPDVENSKDFDTTGNMFIEGDNLEALKILHKSYYGKVKMIYIDPPYNTGNDFVYNDKFAENRRDYLAETGEIDDEGFATRTDGLRKNSRDNGHFHSNWLNMMYPRLYLARNLLRADGVIFVSIDDNEVANLRLIMDEIFGAENFVAQFIWHSSTGGGIRAKFANVSHQYILCYARAADELDQFFAPLSAQAISAYNKKDEKGTYREKDFAWKNSSWGANQKYLIETPDGERVKPRDGYLYRFIRETFEEALADDMVVFKKTDTGPLVTESGEQAHWNIYIKKYLGDGTGAPTTVIPRDLVGINNEGTTDLGNMLGGNYFQSPKNVRLIKYLISIGDVKSDDIVLDFFAGSGTTAQAVMELNAEDGGNRKWILVQLPEETDEKSEARKAGYATIADISTERIRRAGAKIGKGDTGFKLYKVSDSNFKKWNENVADADELRQQTFDRLNPLVDGANDGDLLVELLLKNGISPLDIVENHGEWHLVPSANLAICLSHRITTELFGEILAANPTKVIILDLGFNNDSQLKANVSLQAGEKDVEVEVA